VPPSSSLNSSALQLRLVAFLVPLAGRLYGRDGTAGSGVFGGGDSAVNCGPGVMGGAPLGTLVVANLSCHQRRRHCLLAGVAAALVGAKKLQKKLTFWCTAE
jgi:hypothetical protein